MRQKQQIAIGENNAPLLRAAWHCLQPDSVELETLPTKLVYEEASTPVAADVTGGVLLARYSNGLEEHIELTGDMVSGFDITRAGVQTLTVTYGGQTATFDVTVNHVPGAAVQENVHTSCTEAGSYDEVVYCSICHTELSREQKPVEPLGHDLIHRDAQAPTCTTVGWEAYDICQRQGCGYTTYV